MNEIIKFENVIKTFQDGDETIEAVKEATFTIYPGELVAIIGPSGSGKSTLLTIMGGLQNPSSGKVYFKGENIVNMSQKQRNDLRFNQIGFVLQASNLVPFLTVSEQFELVDKFAGKKTDHEKAKNIMEQFDILHRKNQYPGDLSGGERQRAAIARALYPDPTLILADEPTASLDTERAINVVKTLQQITQNSSRTTVMVTHDSRLLEYCDRVFRMVDGVMTEESGIDSQSK